MTDPLAGPPQEQGNDGAPRFLVFAALLLAGAVLMAFLWYSTGRKDSQPAAVHLPFSSAEQAYAAALSVEGITLARTENYLHQEVTTITGNLVNSGDRAIARVEFNVEFQDEMRQVVLRHAFISSAPQPVAARGSRAIEISLEHIPSSWNNREPIFRVAGLEFSQQR
jgi:hypothetical protein